MRRPAVFSLVLIGLLAGCASKYHPWNGIKGYQHEQSESGLFQVSYTAEKFTGWDRIDGYLQRRCQELTGLDADSVAVEGIEHAYTHSLAQSETSVGTTVRQGSGSADSVAAPVSTHHDVLYKLKQARGTCTAVNQ